MEQVHNIVYITARAGHKAGIKNTISRVKHFNPHIFRHSIARYLKNKGFAAEWVQNFLGHASYKTTMDVYGTISIDEMLQGAENRLQE